MNFGQALEALKQGQKVARKGWNGKGMYIFLVSEEANSEAISEFYSDEEVVALPSIGMYTVDSNGRRAFLNGWLASQTDMLSDDWVLAD